MWRVEFSSGEFLPFLPEECQANPGAYGFELALWLAKALAEQGIVTSYPNGEDWGWFIEYIKGETEITIGCSSIADEGAGYIGKPIQWSIFVRPQRTLKQRLKGYSPEAVLRELTAAIEAALKDKGLSFQHVEA